MINTGKGTSSGILEHIISDILELEEKITKTKLHETKDVHQRFTTLERYPIVKLLILYDYLLDLALENPLRDGIDKLFPSNDEENTFRGKIHTQLKVIERILYFPDEIPTTIVGHELLMINSYGYRSEHLKGRIYGHRNTMTLISRQCRYYLFKGMYFDLDLKNAHPTILLSYAHNFNLKVEVLERYVNNREDFLQEVTLKDGLTRDEAKTVVLRCLNLISDKSVTPHLKPLHKDILSIREHMYKKNISENITSLGEYTMTRESFKGKSYNKQKISLQSQYCATEESKSLYVLYEVCIRKGLLNRNTLSNIKGRNLSFIPFFDGAYVNFENLDEDGVNQIIEDTNKLIFPYSFVLKSVEPEWSFLKEETLYKYEKIHTFLGKLSETQYNKLLDSLGIPSFTLETKELDKLEFLAKEDIRNPEKVLPDGCWEDIFTNSEDLKLLVAKTTMLHKYSLRKSLLKRIDEGTFVQLQKDIGFTKDFVEI